MPPLLITSRYLTKQKHRLCHKLVVPYFKGTLQPEVHQPIATSLPATAPPVQQAVFGGESELPKKHTHDWQLPTKSQLFFRWFVQRCRWRWIIGDESFVINQCINILSNLLLKDDSQSIYWKKSAKFTKISSLPSFGGHLQGFGLQLWQ